MTRLHFVLLVLWLAELAGGAYWYSALQARRRPPDANLEALDPIAADEIRSLTQRCRTPAQWRQLGEALMAFGAYRESEACHRMAATEDPNDAEALYQWAFALERLGLLDEANEQYRRAAALEPGLPAECSYFMGRNLERQEKPEAALAALEGAPAVPAARYEQARLLGRLGRFKEALSLVEALSRQFPRTWPTAYLRYRIERLAGNDDRREVFADAAALAVGPLPNPLDRHWQRLRSTKQELGMSRIIEQAGAAGAQLPSFEPELLEIHRRFWFTRAADLLAEARFQKGEPAQARRLLAEAIDRNGPSAHLLNRLGVVCEQLGDREAALEAWTRAIRLGAAVELQDVHMRLAARCEQDGDQGAARRHVAMAHFGAGVEAFWRAEYAAADKALRAAVESDPRHAAAWFYLGETYRLLGDNRQAQSAYERCLALHPEDGWAQRGLRLAKQTQSSGRMP